MTGGGGRPRPTPIKNWVDLGLPSGTKWATRNLSFSNSSGFANHETDPGSYFSWGNTEGHAANSGYNFSRQSYQETPGYSVDSDLSSENDAATQLLGSLWRIPSKTEAQELKDNCTIQETSINGIVCHVFTSNINGNQLIIPCRGKSISTEISDENQVGYYWLNSIESGENADALVIYGTTNYPGYPYARYTGMPIRPVRS